MFSRREFFSRQGEPQHCDASVEKDQSFPPVLRPDSIPFRVVRLWDDKSQTTQLSDQMRGGNRYETYERKGLKPHVCGDATSSKEDAKPVREMYQAVEPLNSVEAPFLSRMLLGSGEQSLRRWTLESL